MSNRYFETVYSNFWKQESEVYGKQEEEGLDRIIEKLKSFQAENAFEVGIGTGWPIAAELYANGTHVAGCDVAESLIRTAQETYPEMELFVGDIWQVPLEKGKYDLVYCIRSSWYMKDFLNVISRMLELTKSGGIVVFNILNNRNFSNKKAILKGFFIRLAVRLYGAMKVLLLNKDYIAVPPSYLYNLKEVKKVLDKYEVVFQVVSINQLLGDKQFVDNSQKLLFIVRKERNGM